ncbi:MAG: response regulator transcription factor [Planctomycetes bacterium]|nr:response regulator transcription factor [Planctomycetota bacterium]
MKLLLVEDSASLRANLETGFRGAGFAVDTAADGTEGLRLAREKQYDVVVLDFGLPSLDGMDVLQAMRVEGNGARVLALTARDSLQDRLKGLDGGADDYVVKPFSFDELLARVRALCRRAYGAGGSAIQLGDLALDLSERVARVGDRALELTRREYALLEHLAFRRGQVVKREEIENSLYESADGPKSNVVDAGILRLRKKLVASGCKATIETLRGIGYRLDAASG